MEQSEVRTLVATAQNSVAAAFWVATDAGVRQSLSDLGLCLNQVLTLLNQEDLSSRAEEFNCAADWMRGSVLPGIKKLDASVERVTQVEGAVKVALSDAMKLSQSVSFFKLPSIV